MLKNTIKIFLFYTISIVCGFYNITSIYAQTWNLENCIDTALQNNLHLKSSLINTQISKINLQNSKHHLLPSLNAGVTHGYNWGQTIDLFTNQFATDRVMFDNFYLNSSVTLFSGLQNFYSIKANGIALKENELELEIFKRNVKIDVAAAFLQVMLNEEIIKIAKDNLLRTNQQFQRIQELVKENQATQFELAEIEAQKQMDIYTITKAENDCRYAKLLLQQLMNIPVNEDFDVALSNIVAPTFITDTNLASLPEIVKIELNIQKHLYFIKSLKGQYFPSIYLSGSVGSGYSENNKMLNSSGNFVPRPFNVQFNNNLYQSLSFTLNIPIFNKNATKNQLKIKELELQSLYTNKQAEQLQLKQKIEQLSTDILNLAAQVEALEKVQASAQINYDNFTIRYETGNATYTQLVEAKNKLFQAQSELTQANFQLLFKQTILGFYCC